MAWRSAPTHFASAQYVTWFTVKNISWNARMDFCRILKSVKQRLLTLLQITNLSRFSWNNEKLCEPYYLNNMFLLGNLASLFSFWIGCAKGQEISRAHFHVLNSSKKRRKSSILVFQATRIEDVSRFFWKNWEQDNFLLKFFDL